MKTVITSSVKRTMALVALCLFTSASLMAQILCNANFTHQPGNTVNSVHFTSAANTTLLASYAWTFGDGHASTMANPTHTYAAGHYLACLTVTIPSSNGTILCTATYCDSIHVGTNNPLNCNAHFTHSNANNTLNAISFTSAQNPANTAYAWNFGDGHSSTQANPTHTYAAGHYLACLTVTSAVAGVSCTATFCDSIHIVPTSVICNANFTHTQASTVSNVHFVSAANPAGTLHSWHFGDGTTSSLPNPYHLYAPGHYLACHTVTVHSTTGAVLCTATVCDSIHISPVNVNCNSQFTHQPTSAGHHFTSASNPTGTTYNWTFGDGGTSHQANPTHLYAPGHYQACLTVTVVSAAGNILCTSTHCDSIHIGNNTPNCTANFGYHHLQAALTYGFNNLSSPNATGYLWHFGDATTSMQANPVHHYMAAGQYQVCVTMFDTVHHCSRTNCKTLGVTVNMAPQAISAAKVIADDEGDEDLLVTVYPNPVSDRATISIEHANTAVSFTLFDNTGRVAAQLNNLSNGYFELNSTDFAAGMYYYRVTGESNKLVSGKLMIQK